MTKWIVGLTVAALIATYLVGAIGERATRQLRDAINTETRAKQDAGRKEVAVIEAEGVKDVTDLDLDMVATDAAVKMMTVEITDAEKDSPCSVSAATIKSLNKLPR